MIQLSYWHRKDSFYASSMSEHLKYVYEELEPMPLWNTKYHRDVKNIGCSCIFLELCICILVYL